LIICTFDYRSVVRRGLCADICSNECSLVSHPSLTDAGQHPARTDDVLRYDADWSHPQPVLARHGDRGRPATIHHSILVVHLLQCRRHRCHNHLLHHYIPLGCHSTPYHLLPDTGKSTLPCLSLGHFRPIDIILCQASESSTIFGTRAFGRFAVVIFYRYI